MASTDSTADVTAFAKQNNANFAVLSDQSKETSKAYGVLSERGFAKRWTYYIGADGVIDYIDMSTNPRTAGADLAVRMKELGY